jgi:hypothetical protein
VVEIGSLVPATGSTTGGTRVTISGTGFFLGFADSAAIAKLSSALSFGDAGAADFSIIDDRTLEAVTPPGPAGPADVTLLNPNGTAKCAGCFLYTPRIELTALTPSEGPQEGGTEVVFSGEGFSPDLVLLVGDRACIGPTFIDSRTMRAIVPGSPVAGPVDVRVFNQRGLAVLRRGFSYLPGLGLDAASPCAVPLPGGLTVALTGRGLTQAQTLEIAGVVAPFSIADDSRIELIAPAQTVSGPVDLIVRAASASASLRSGLVYYDPLASGRSVLGASPARGPSRGGQRSSIVGNGFAQGDSVRFGGALAGGAVVVSPNLIEATTPPGPAGAAVDISVASATEEASLRNGYRYNLALTSIAPTSGPTSAGTQVTVSGEGFAGELELSLGPLLATSLVLQGTGVITALAPAGAGRVDVVLRSRQEPESSDSLPGGYLFVEPLFLGRIEPAMGAIAGGTFVTVNGTGFGPATRIELGGKALKDVRLVSPYVITGRTPPGTSGAVDVTARDASAQDTIPGAFTYFDPANPGGGSSGGALDGTINVTVLDQAPGHYGDPLVNALVSLGAGSPFAGLTNLQGQITFSDPSLALIPEVTVSKAGYQTVTVPQPQSQNLTVLLTPSGSEGSLLNLVLPSPDLSANSGPVDAGAPCMVSGRVVGFKLPRPLKAWESAWAEVSVAPQSAWASPPFGTIPSAEERDGRGERWKVTSDGGPFTVFASRGEHVLYAIFGIYDGQHQSFSPLLMGLRRKVDASPSRPVVGADIILDMHLDQEVPVIVHAPVKDRSGLWAVNQTFVWLELSNEGVIPIGSAVSGDATLTLRGLPRLDGDSFLFLNRASAASAPSGSFSFRRQLGDLTAGVVIGPMLGFVELIEPKESVSFQGHLAWQVGSGQSPSLFAIDLTWSAPGQHLSLWSTLVPGDVRSIDAPRQVMDAIAASRQEGASLDLTIFSIRAAHFDYSSFSYSHLSQDSWSAWTETQRTLTP